MSNDESDSLEGALGNVSQLLRKRVRDLEKREEEFKRMKKSFEEANPAAGNPSDVLRLNVGGSRIDVLRRTLTSVDGSMLAARFSGRWDDSLEKDADGNFFIDQPIDLFLPLVEYLRAKACMTPLARPVASPASFRNLDVRNNFFRMLEYYGMTLGVYPFGIFEGDDTDSRVFGHPDYSIESEQWKTFKLLPLPGNTITSIRSYQVTLGKATNAKIGWVSRDTSIFSETEQEGVGYIENSISLDSSRSGFAIHDTASSPSASFSAIAGLPSLGQGTVVRTENMGKKWYVNGELVASESEEEGGVTMTSDVIKHGSLVPCLSVKGNVRISNIELNF